MKKIVWDLGANDGSDIEYYSRFADLVISVEAIPELCEQIRRKYQHLIQSKSLVVYNGVLSFDARSQSVPFWIHRQRSGESTSLLPDKSTRDEFEPIELPVVRLDRIFADYGHPYYVKVDLEGFDFDVVHNMFGLGIFPEFLSAEVQNLKVASLIIARPEYRSFNLVNGRTLSNDYRRALISAQDGVQLFNFNSRMSGPMGYDIRSPWSCEASIFRLIAVEGEGWKDIHASRSIEPNVRNISLANVLLRTFKRRLIEICNARGFELAKSYF